MRLREQLVSQRAKLRALALVLVPLAVVLVRAPLDSYPLTLLCFAVLALAVMTLWTPREPPLAMMVVVYQWLQASTKLLHANLLGIPLNDMLVAGSFGAMHPVMGALGEATVLSLLGLLTLVGGLALARRLLPLTADPVSAVAPEPSGTRIRQRLVVATLITIAGSSVLKNLQYSLPGSVTQIILPLIDLKWALVFALTCAVFRSRAGYAWLAVICGAEVVLGFAAYFSAWKEVILILVLGYFFCRPGFELRRVALGFGLVLLGLGLAVFWTAIKVEQRQFLNQGTGQQVVVRGTSESLANAFDLAAATEVDEYAEAANRLAERIAYVDYFANALLHVPAVRAHEGGALWWRAVTHIFTPRILFPDKPPLLSDSEQTMYYTGLRLASSFEGTSISLGYMAESYIDFGVPGMFVPIFFWGLVLGLGMRLLVARFGAVDLVWGTAAVVMLNSLILEVTAVKMVGGTLMSIIVMFLTLNHLGAWAYRQIYSERVVSSIPDSKPFP